MSTAAMFAGGNTQGLATSPDGFAWTQHNISSANYWQDCAYSPPLDLWVIGGGNSGVGTTHLVTSTNLSSFTTRTTGVDTIHCIEWIPHLGLFLMGSNSVLKSSPDGITWTDRGTKTGINSITYVAELGLFFNFGSSSIDSSPDAITWTTRYSQMMFLTQAAWSPELHLLVAVGTYGSASSPDGITWTWQQSTKVFTGVAWSPTLRLFVGFGVLQVAPSTLYFRTSTDGKTWTERTPPPNGAAWVIWSPQSSMFLAQGSDAAYNGRALTSVDGITWAQRGLMSVNNCKWSPGSNLAPYAPTPTSPLNVVLDRSLVQRLAWTFADPNFGDSQSKFDLQWRLGSGSWTQTTGTTPNQFWDAPAATFPAGAIEWQARTYDSVGLVGPWSASSFFTAADAPPGPTITVPTSGATVSSTSMLTWSAPAQTDYQWRRVADNAGVADTATVYFDTGDVVDTVTRSRIVASPVNLRWEHVQVRIKFSGLWSPWADCRVYVSFTAPAVPTLTATADNATGSVLVTVTNPTPTGSQPTVISNDIYISSPLDPEYRAATGVPVNGTWRWWTPGSGRVYTISAVAIGDNATTSRSA